MLFRAGAEVIHGALNDIHTSGHGGQEEQKINASFDETKILYANSR